MITGPLFSFFGAKWNLAPLYPPPMHRAIVEPFAGSACYSLRYASRDVVLVERDPVVASVWRWLLSASASDVRALPDVTFGQDIAELEVPDGARALIGFWLNAACPRPARRPSKWMRIYGDAGESPTGALFWSDRVRERIASALPLIRHWTLIEGDYTEAPPHRATWFVDPPYEREGKRYHCSSKLIDFSALGAWCRERTGQIIVCENEGASWLPFRSFRHVFGNAARRSNGRATPRSREAVWLAGDGQLALEGFVR